MIKVLTVLGTRPEIIKMSLVLNEFDRVFKHIVVHTGQNYDYELNKIFFEDLNIKKPKYFLNSKSRSPIKTISIIIDKIEAILKKEKPNAFVIYGDTNSCLSAYVAKRLKIPIFHFEAGNRCFDENVPEEINRKIIDHISDINFVISKNARNYLIREGIKQNLIIKTGSHLKEVIHYYNQKIENSAILKKMNIDKNNYIVASIHREENVDNNKKFYNILNCFKKISKIYKKKIIFSLHPRSKKKIKSLKINLKLENIYFSKPFGFFDYLKLQKNSFCTISDSGTISEESYLLKFPAISLRNNNERPEAIDSGTLITSGLKDKTIIESVKLIDKNRKKYLSHNIIKDYEVSNVSSVAVKSIFTFVDYINRTVWNKQ